MKRAPRTVVLFAVTAAFACRGDGGSASRRPADSARRAPEAMQTFPSTPARVALESDLDSLVTTLDTISARVERGDAAGARSAFHSARLHYKRAEGLLQIFAPALTVALNGPLEGEGDGDDAPPRPYGSPAAFQLIESALRRTLTDTSRALLASQIGAMRQRVQGLRLLTPNLDIPLATALDAARLELARVSTLDLAGFDSEYADSALVEAAAALEGTRATLGGAQSALLIDVASALDSAAAHLRAHADFEHLDRLGFLVGYAQPAAEAIAAARANTAPQPAPLQRAWRIGAASVFDSGAFDPSAFATAYARAPEPEVVPLGAALFHDPRLSGPGSRSCATCHQPARAFTDGLARRAPLPGGVGYKSRPARNTPTLLNAALQPALFADARAAALEDQIARVLADSLEMQSSAVLAARRLHSDTAYRAAFARTFDLPADEAVTEQTLRVALASYVRSLTALDSRFDRAVRGDTAALTAEERRGFTLFMGKARCGTCHFAPLFNGTSPPAYASSEAEIIGVPERDVDHEAHLDPDPGRGGIDHVDSHRFAFKVPTLRNVALTGPYMHNGAFATLERVVDFYDRGGGAGLGLHVPYQTLSSRPLHLSPVERRALIAFLKSLTDTTTSRATSVLPSLSSSEKAR